MIEIRANKAITKSEIKLLREVSGKSLSEIKQAAKSATAISRFEVFGSQWQETKQQLVKLYKLAKSLDDPQIIFFDLVLNEVLSLEVMQAKFEHWRFIELDTQKQSDLENGFINSSKAFKPHDSEWI